MTGLLSSSEWFDWSIKLRLPLTLVNDSSNEFQKTNENNEAVESPDRQSLQAEDQTKSSKPGRRGTP